MQNKRLHKNFRYLSGIDETDYSEIVWQRKEKLQLFDQLLDDGCIEKTALQAIGFSRAKYYRLKSRYKKYGLSGLENISTKPHRTRTRQWSKKAEQAIIEIRTRYNFWGKEKIAQILKRDYQINLSISSVGRIITLLVSNKKIKPVAFYTGKYLPKPRIFNNYAKRLPVGIKGGKPGELIQIDHMTVKLISGQEVKHFEAICPFTRVSISRAYLKATSLNATKFLDFVIEKLPFPVISIQVDGGSEFMGDFEQACKKRQYPLFVIPPRSPQINGSVERVHGTIKSEFYSQYNHNDSVNVINFYLQQYQDLYNNIRPHRGLQCLTPMEYCKKMGAFKNKS